MFSLRRQINNLDDLAVTQKALLDAYAAAIDAVAEKMPDSPRELFEDARQKLKQRRAALAGTFTLTDIQKQGVSTTADIGDYGQRITGYLRRQQAETRDILELLSTVTDTVSKRDKENSVRLQNITKKLRLLTTAEDLAEIKWKLTQEVEQFEKSIAEMDRTNEAAIERLRESARRPATPNASPLPPRKPGVRFCLGLIQLLTPAAGDADTVIRASVDADDRVEKLSEREYVILKAGSLVETADLLELIRRELERSRIDALVGAAEQTRGETKDQLLERARQSFRPRNARA